VRLFESLLSARTGDFVKRLGGRASYGVLAVILLALQNKR
jgi:hypothetical protein